MIVNVMSLRTVIKLVHRRTSRSFTTGTFVVKALPVLALALSFAWPNHAVAQNSAWPRRVLITNDNGIDDVATRALAREFARVADVVLVASTEDRSGTSNVMSFTRTGRFVVERRDVDEGVRAWALDGSPADCVIFALAGPMSDALPDLVVSGSNGGANMADEWFGSGTIGAARTAAMAGIPALAVSGIDRSDPQAIAAVVDWVIRLAQSEIVQQLRPPSYLTVSLPAVAPEQITGVEVVDRARGVMGIAAAFDSTASKETGKEVWSVELGLQGQPDEQSDIGALGRGHIAVVPMRVGDADPELLAWLRNNAGQLPVWRASPQGR
jgi:5'-nucleotidase